MATRNDMHQACQTRLQLYTGRNPHCQHLGYTAELRESVLGTRQWHVPWTNDPRGARAGHLDKGLQFCKR
jgi:hypothetical protein